MKVAVTGAFGYSGRYMAHRLLQDGHEVMTLTNPLRRANPFGDKVDAGVLNAIGPETFTYRELVEMIAGL